MDILIALLLIVVIILMLTSRRRLSEDLELIQLRITELDHNLRARQSRTKWSNSQVKPPQAERPRTTTRDTNDLPGTGQQVAGLKFNRTHGRIDKINKENDAR